MISRKSDMEVILNKVYKYICPSFIDLIDLNLARIRYKDSFELYAYLDKLKCCGFSKFTIYPTYIECSCNPNDPCETLAVRW